MMKLKKKAKKKTLFTKQNEHNETGTSWSKFGQEIQNGPRFKAR